MKCEYCGHHNEKDLKKCKTCGAPIEEIKEDQWKSAPFFYNGYICYAIFDPLRRTREIQFWLGKQLIERIEVDVEILKDRVPEYCDPMTFFWDLFLLAHGEKEVIEWQEKNDKFPAKFIITCVQNSELMRLRELSLNELADESKR